MKSKAVYKKKIIALVLVALAMSIIVGGTLAYYTSESGYVKNTFTSGKVDILLTESDNDYKMIPGFDIKKDPRVIVLKGSSASWVFVKLEKKNGLGSYIEYSVVSGEKGWTQLKDNNNQNVEGVYYRKEAAVKDYDHKYSVLLNDKVSLKSNVGKDELDSLTKSGTKPILEITAYAIQSDNISSPYTAWTELN